MAERIQGITIVFDGDTKGLKKALTELNNSAKKTNTALNEVNRALKLKPNSVTLLTQKQQLLKQRVMEATDKVRVLKMRLDEMGRDPSVDKKSAEYQKLQRQLIMAQAYQKKFTKEMILFGNAKFNAVGNSLQMVGNKLTNVTRRARQAFTALAAIALYKGFERLKTLDDVSTELKKLGYEGKKLDNIMDAATGSVSGTKYALTDMSKVAKGALGAGVEQSYKLGDYLQRVADLSAVAGVGVDKMGALMNKALSKGVIDARLLNQLNANGIPIYTLLAESMGVTKQELDKLVRSGQVGFDDLYKATEKYKGMAQELGTETLSGAVTVLGQQFGLMGAEFLSGAYEPIKSGVQGIVKWLKELRDNGTIKEWGTAVGETIKYFVEYFKNGSTATEELSSKAQGLITAFSPLVMLVGKIVQAFMSLSPQMKVIAAGFALFGGPLLTLTGGLIKFVGIIVNLVSVFRALGLAMNIAPIFAALNPVVLAVIAVLAALVAIGVAVYKNWDTIKQYAISTWNSIKNAVSIVVAQIQTNFNTLKTFLSNVWNGIKTAASAAWNAVKTAMVSPIQTAVNTVKSLINKVKGFFPVSVGKLFKNLKLPHFSLNWSSKDFGKLGSIKYPTGINVSWYKKAMTQPYMFTNPTVFGAGEAGDEMLYGKNALMNDIAKAVSGTGEITINVYANENMNVRELASEVERVLIQSQKRRTQVWA